MPTTRFAGLRKALRRGYHPGKTFRIILTVLLLVAFGGEWEPVRAQERDFPPLDGDILTRPANVAEQPRAPELDYKLVVYYVLPSDIAFDHAVYNRLVSASQEVQAWYQVATGGLTWEFAEAEIVRVYHGQQTRQYYVDNGSWWGSLLGEMQAAGEYIWAPGVVTALWAHGAGWWAGAAWGCEGDCGIALLGVELFPQFNNPDWSTGECPDPDGEGGEAWPCTPLGAYAHELGHTVQLIHPIDNPVTEPYAGHSIMLTHWHYPNHAPAEDRPWGFLASERQTVRANPFMKPGIDLRQIFQDAVVNVNLPPAGDPPAANFTVQASGYAITLTNTTQAASPTYWTFGDFSASNVISPTHTYAFNGVYTVTLRASNDQAMMGVMTSTVVIDGIVFYLPLVMQ